MEQKKKRVGDIDIHVAERLALMRKSRHKTQSELSDILGVSFQQYQKYENGRDRMTSGALYKLAEALDIDVGDFFGGLNPKRKKAALTPYAGLDKDTRQLLSLFQRIEDKNVRKSILRFLKSFDKGWA